MSTVLNLQLLELQSCHGNTIVQLTNITANLKAYYAPAETFVTELTPVAVRVRLIYPYKLRTNSAKKR